MVTFLDTLEGPGNLLQLLHVQVRHPMIRRDRVRVVFPQSALVDGQGSFKQGLRLTVLSL